MGVRVTRADELHLPEILHAMDFDGGVVDEMLAEPDRALACIRYAVYEPGIAVPRAYAIAIFREGRDPRWEPDNGPGT